ncbi:MARVEL domain-containing protein 3 [Megalops cyprinoides]|uniref:MARVEL domain-containing protein 3 n=1 Tax=Megalops cyprinoides TaxID=118141 RepID=UPI001864DC6C|nr:MARVEL domain-containing protein 3 [Megalops cyprinoides]XP_036377825.1 MARVEL domain-containing protein 3 [Megalops cyprinoides]XP_036377826.1 MARVEL domain-containing protein 3 [Megalops cyprinoides]XP_036377827.1 MARVEL domain-containing protein 3 [Megalops cyprinoides]
MSQPSRPHRGQRERNGDHREQRARRDQHNGRPPSDRSSQPPYYPKMAREAPRENPEGSKCTHICSRRGIVLICAVLTNALVLICVVAAQMVMSGMSAMGGLSAGSFSINSAYSPFEGTELQQVRDLDMQYSQMRSPGIYGGVAFSLTMGVISLLFVVSGNRPAHLLSPKLLAGQFFFQLVGAVAYVVAVGLYLHFVIKVNATDVCQQRARLYARQGYTWMNCDVGGADAAVALFGLITAILYGIGCVLTGQTIRRVRSYRQERERYEATRRNQGDGHRSANPQRAPLRSDTTPV